MLIKQSAITKAKIVTCDIIVIQLRNMKSRRSHTITDYLQTDHIIPSS